MYTLHLQDRKIMLKLIHLNTTCTEDEYKVAMRRLLNKEVILTNEVLPRSKITLVRRKVRIKEDILVKIPKESQGEPHTKGPSHCQYIATIYNLCLKEVVLQDGMDPAGAWDTEGACGNM